MGVESGFFFDFIYNVGYFGVRFKDLNGEIGGYVFYGDFVDYDDLVFSFGWGEVGF